jgi:hypothetical protein
VALRSGKVGRSGVGGPAGVMVGLAAGATVVGGIAAAMTALVGPGKAASARSGAAVVESRRTELDVAGPDGRRPDGARAESAELTGCRCGHDAAAHEHFRPGSDCGACGAGRCGRFRRVQGGTSWRDRWRAGRTG